MIHFQVHDRSVLQKHFNTIHWGESIRIPKNHATPFPHCERCDQQMSPWLQNNNHYSTKVCRLGQERCRCWETMQQCFEVNEVTIRVNLNPLEAKKIFTYLARTATYNNSDWEMLYSNLRKAQRI